MTAVLGGLWDTPTYRGLTGGSGFWSGWLILADSEREGCGWRHMC